MVLVVGMYTMSILPSMMLQREISIRARPPSSTWRPVCWRSHTRLMGVSTSGVMYTGDPFSGNTFVVDPLLSMTHIQLRDLTQVVW